jgi:hypothetical protein
MTTPSTAGNFFKVLSGLGTRKRISSRGFGVRENVVPVRLYLSYHRPSAPHFDDSIYSSRTTVLQLLKIKRLESGSVDDKPCRHGRRREER